MMMKSDLEVRRWQQDLWVRIIRAALYGNPDQLPLDWHPPLARPAVMKYVASSPARLRWLKTWNACKLYEDQVRPFGFLLEFTLRKSFFAEFTMEPVESAKRVRPRSEEIKPIAPYETDSDKALQGVFDRLSGKPVDIEQLKTYAECLADYHISPENKFENGDYHDRGRTERRHVIATKIVLMGKEANRVDDSGAGDPLASAVEVFSTVGKSP